MKVATKTLPANVVTFLALLQHTEGTDKYANPYTTRYGGSQVLPDQPHDGRAITAGGYTSTAIGAYQFLYRTWRSLHSGANPPMTATAQDKAAVQLIKDAGAYNDVLQGRWQTAIEKTNRIWASLPGSPYGQPTFTLKKALDFIKSNASKIAPIGLLVAAATVFF